MISSQQNKTFVNFVKNSAVSMGIAAGILSVPHSPLGLESGPVSAQIRPQRPNAVVIMTDDLSSGELKIALNKGWMPNLKTHLINRGTAFTQSFVTNALCCPSRATFLTGQYSHNHGVRDNILPKGGFTKLKDNSTLATWLKQVGYRTSFVGKYLNGYGYRNPTYIPPGWDDWQALVREPSNQYNYAINDNGRIVNYGADPATPPQEYQTDVLARRSASFINESEAISDTRPFFLFITTSAPHAESSGEEGMIRPAPRHQGTGRTIALPQPPSFNEPDVSDKPAWLRQGKPQLNTEKLAKIQRAYQSRLEAMRAVDDLIGRVVTALAQNGELDNTVLIFTSDNGYLFGEHRLYQKVQVYEEAIRVPLYIRAPRFSTKQSVSKFVLNNDLAPTIAAFAGAKPGIPVDGRSLIPLLRNPKLATWRKRFLIENFREYLLPPPYFAVRTSSTDTATPNQLYVKYSTGDQEFYNLASDRYQLQSLHNQPGIRQKQMQILKNHLAKLKGCKGQSCRILEGN